MPDLGLLKERAKYKKLCREAEALYVAIQISTTESKKAAQRAITQTNALEKSELRQRIHALESKISKIRGEFGARVPSSVFLELLEKTIAFPGKDFLVPKFYITGCLPRPFSKAAGESKPEEVYPRTLRISMSRERYMGEDASRRV